MVHTNPVFLKISIGNGKAAKLRYPQTCFEQNEDPVVILAVTLVFLDKFQECPFLRSGDGFSGYTVVDNYGGQLKGKGIPVNQTVLQCHFKRRPDNPADRMNGTVTASVFLQFNKLCFGIGLPYFVNPYIAKGFVFNDVYHKIVVGTGVVPDIDLQGQVFIYQIQNSQISAVGNDLVE